MLFGKSLSDGDQNIVEKVKPKSSNDDDSNEVTRDDNHIYFYTDVNKASILDLNKSLKTAANEMLHTANVLEISPPDIILHINSPGGSLLDCLATVDVIRKSKVKVRSVVEGFAASAATLISVMAHRRVINKHSYMLIHQLSSGSYGKFEELLEDMENNKTLMKVIKQIYLERTKIPENLLKEILKKDLYFDAKQCLKYGLVDEILD